ncbi:Sugar phosphate permease [Natronorubrum texcoconense]|uniref:Sugar phosphate permease n=2 Tax=Natronorubrum texcoconense TaxID=1095776 RepID=A0A1G8YEC4_9EURY|nr:MFS transporter [Natronorubrum texcoconense]SDK01279.1 Sugar phosphate permease [Natronorubrum texcoconense]
MDALRGDGRGTVLVAVACGWGLSMGVRMIYPVLLPHLQVAYDLDYTSAGLLLTVLFLAYAFGQLPGGLLADRFAERYVLAGSVALCAATILLVVTAGTPALLFLATILFGFGAALYAVARYTTLARLYPDTIGSANGVTAAAQDAGQSLLPPLAGSLAGVLAWQYGFGFAIPLFVLVALLLWWVVPESDDDGSSVDSDATDDSGSETDAGGALSLETARLVASELRNPSILYGTAIFTLGLCIWQAFTGFYPTYVIEVKGLSSTVASILFGTFFALGVVIKPIAGGAYDRIGLRRSLLVLLGVSGSALAVLPFVEGLVPIAAITVLVSFLLGFGVVTEAYLILELPEEIRGTGFGLLRTIAFGVGALSPVVFGAAADRGLFDYAFFALAAIAGVMILLALRVPAATRNESNATGPSRGDPSE